MCTSWICRSEAQGVQAPDDKGWRYLVHLKYWTLCLMPLMVYPKVLFPLNFITKGTATLDRLFDWADLLC